MESFKFLFFFYKLIIFGLSTIFIFNIAQAQDTTIIGNTKITYIRWVSQFPPLPQNKNKVLSITNSIAKFFFGKHTPVLSKPVSVLANNLDTLWILDQGNGTILQIYNKLSETPQFLDKKNNNFKSLIGFCFMPNNEMLFTDSRLNKVFIISADKKDMRVLNDSLLLQQPTGIAYSSVNNEIWIVETSAHRISVLNKKGELIKRIGGRGSDPGEFNFPTFIWSDRLGAIYVVDAMNFRVQIFDKNGELLSVFGEIGDATGYFARPKGIATDSYGNIYIADALFHVVQIFDKSGNFLYKFGTQGRDKGQFWMPTGIYIDDKDYIYVADSYNSRIQVFQLINGGL
ncbi:MAG: 6-bladed beta-propeller [Bacteroidota bacterium]